MLAAKSIKIATTGVMTVAGGQGAGDYDGGSGGGGGGLIVTISQTAVENHGLMSVSGGLGGTGYGGNPGGNALDGLIVQHVLQ